MASLGNTESIEVAGKQDLPEILRLQKLAFTPVAEASGDMKIAPMVQTLAGLEDEHGKRVVFKYVIGSRIVGSVRGHLDHAGTCHIGRLVVDPEYQGRGIGSRLMDRIEAHFASCSRIEIFTGRVTPNTIRMYGARGYRIFRTEALPFGEMVFMEKDGARRGSVTGERPGTDTSATGTATLRAAFEQQRMSDTWRRVALVTDDFEILVNFMKPGGALPMHAHSHRQIGYCFSGSLQLALEGPALPLRPGDSYRLASGVQHGATVESDTVSLDLKYCCPEDGAAEAAIVSPGLSRSGEEAAYVDRWISCAVISGAAGLESAIERVRGFPSAYLVSVDRAAARSGTPQAAVLRAPPNFEGAEQAARALLAANDVVIIGHRTSKGSA